MASGQPNSGGPGDVFLSREVADAWRRGEAEREATWAEIEQALRRFEGPDGIELPGESLVGSGTK